MHERRGRRETGRAVFLFFPVIMGRREGWRLRSDRLT
jgi:hypothetical protein